jgi:2,4-dienoyl-CoA reductase (NADPH2)
VPRTSLLFEPLQIAGMSLRNRVVMPPMGTNLAEPGGFVNDATIAYYHRRAVGGVGMLTVEASLIAPESHGVGPELRLHGDEFIPGLRHLSSAVKDAGAVAGIQLWHPGRQTTLTEPVAPSAVAISKRTPVPRALTVEDIGYYTERYAQSARVAQEAGFDFVEIHGAHCYLLCEFLSPVVNRREDEYGGSLANRARWPLAVVAAIREACGPGFPILFRLEGSEHVDGGFDIDEATEVARWLEQAGVACISVSAGTWSSAQWTIPPMSMPRGCLVPLAAQIKRAVDVPIIAAGRLDDPVLAEETLAAGHADLIAVGRGLIADPDWPEKVRSGAAEAIRPCIACNACADLVGMAKRAQCAVNPEVARDHTWRLVPAERPLRVMVVGSGPAGMEAARIAALRNHDVSIWERADELGGKLDVASRAPSKSEVLRFRSYEARVLEQLGLAIHTGCEVTPATIEREDPDVVVIATGAGALRPAVPGFDGPMVVDAQEILLGTVAIEPGERVAVVGGGATGCETTEMIVDVAGEVSILDMLPALGAGIEVITRRQLLWELRQRGVRLLPGSTVLAVEPGRLVYEGADGSRAELAVDRVALAVGWSARGLALSAQLNGRPAHVIADAARPADFVAAVNAGADAGLAI